MQNETNGSFILIILQLARVFLNFNRKIAAFLMAWNAETKHLIGCEWVIAAAYRCKLDDSAKRNDIYSET